MAIEIVSFPINSMVIFYSYVSLPEGSSPSPTFPLVTSVPTQHRHAEPLPAAVWLPPVGRHAAVGPFYYGPAGPLPAHGSGADEGRQRWRQR